MIAWFKGNSIKSINHSIYYLSEDISRKHIATYVHSCNQEMYAKTELIELLDMCHNNNYIIKRALKFYQYFYDFPLPAYS